MYAHTHDAQSLINMRETKCVLLTFLFSCNLFCMICLVMVIFCCHGAYASPSPAPLKNSKTEVK